MRVLILFLVVLACAATSCGPSRKSTTTPKDVPLVDTTVAVATQNDGASYETAIVITEKSSGKGIAAEYEWVKQNYPGSKVLSQKLSHYKNKSYDILTIQTAEGVEKKVYFDITGFFGKW